MSENEICPGCGRHCSLSAPRCGRGEEYLRTGKLPEPRHGEDGRHGKHMQRCQQADQADPNDRLILNFREISHMMRMQYEGKASQKRILIILKETGGLTQKELTERLGVQPGSASEILSKLENAGLIARTANEEDRRTTDVCLTDAGAALALEAAEQRKARHEEMFSCLSQQEQETLLSLLEKIRADWQGRFAGRRGGHDGGRRGRHFHRGQ